ncbi:MAG TPA: hypothetical protein VEJ46_00090 [Candidatus Acidoferrum sp.]|nr:hypothetical protein [Candidatus Acidoferrum sp.]
MRTFRAVVILSWLATALNLILFMAFPAYSRHVPYEIEGLLFFVALLVFALYKVYQLYRAGMNRSK